MRRVLRCRLRQSGLYLSHGRTWVPALAYPHAHYILGIVKRTACTVSNVWHSHHADIALYPSHNHTMKRTPCTNVWHPHHAGIAPYPSHNHRGAAQAHAGFAARACSAPPGPGPVFGVSGPHGGANLGRNGGGRHRQRGKASVSAVSPRATGVSLLPKFSFFVSSPFRSLCCVCLKSSFVALASAATEKGDAGSAAKQAYLLYLRALQACLCYRFSLSDVVSLVARMHACISL